MGVLEVRRKKCELILRLSPSAEIDLFFCSTTMLAPKKQMCIKIFYKL